MGVAVRMAVQLDVLARPQKPAAQRMTDLLITGARLLDPASGLDAPGALLVRQGRIAVPLAPTSAAPRASRAWMPAARAWRRGLSICAPRWANRGRSIAKTIASAAEAVGGRRHHHPLRAASILIRRWMIRR